LAEITQALFGIFDPSERNNPEKAILRLPGACANYAKSLKEKNFFWLKK